MQTLRGHHSAELTNTVPLRVAEHQFGMQSIRREKNDAFKWFIQLVCKSDYHEEGKRKRAKSGDRD